jgi:hypothetical protein
MRTLLSFVLATAIAVVLATWSVGAALERSAPAIRNGPWTTDLKTGSAEADLYHRARIATHGLWALPASEVVYFTATTDSAGVPLSPDARYRIEGTDPDTRWWSIAAYSNDHFIPNDLERYSFSQTTVQRERDRSWVIRLSPEPLEPNWLPSGDQPGTLVLTLRCYNPGATIAADPGGVPLPEILREDAL